MKNFELFPQPHKWPLILGGIGLILVTAFLTVWLVKFFTPAPKTNEAFIAPQAFAVQDEVKIPTVDFIQPKVFKNKKKVKQKLKLPDQVIQSEQIEVLDTAYLDGKDDRPKDIASVIDTQTGETKTYIITKERPWFSTDTRGHADIAYGYKSGFPTVRLSATQYLFDVKAVRFGVTGSVENVQDRQTDTFIGVSAEYHW